MSKFTHNKLVILLGVIFVVLIVIVLVVTGRFGLVLNARVENTTPDQPKEVILKEKKNIRKITIQKNDDRGCIEITPEGAVRVYTECNQELDDAYRETDVQNIMKLFNKLGRTDLSSYSKKPPANVQRGEPLYKITIETDVGVETIYLYFDDEVASQANDIVKIIQTLTEDPVYDSPTPTQGNSSPSPTSIYTLTPTPTNIPGGNSPTNSPTPTGFVGEEDDLIDPFTCVFDDEQGNKKPYRVSNVVCSTEPEPNK
ncbi:hypothetical protein ACFL1P_00465 [Patescibacteria group bacterium]